MIRILTLLALFVAPVAQADALRLEQAFRGWVAQEGVQTAVMTVWRRGQHQADVALGRAAAAPVELASLSKAVTGLCAAALIRSGVWRKGTTSRDVLGKGPDGLSVARLMTHSAGLGPDLTQTLMPLWLDTPQDRAALASDKALGRNAQTATVDSYAYNNENYAILGAMISAETGVSHVDYCRNAVLIPAGVTTAAPSPRTGSMAAWGGWAMSVQDYARLMHWAYGPGGMIGRAPQNWPQSDIGGGAFYGVGMTQRAFHGSMNYWHFGALCFPGRMDAGSYAVSWMQDWSVVVAYDACVDWDAMVRLDGALAGAVLR